MCFLADLELNYNQDCKKCEFNTVCILEDRLKHIEIVHEANRIIINHPEILDENLFTKYN
jgi:hypothetical protein